MPILAALWPLLLMLLQTLMSYLLGRGVFESLLLVGIRKYCKRWPNPTVIELAIAWSDSVGKRHLLGDIEMPPEKPRAPSNSNGRQSGFTTTAFMSLICIVGAALIVGYSVGVHHAGQSQVPVEYKPAKPLPGGGLQLSTVPDAKPKAAQPVAAGSKIAAVGQVKVKPKPVAPVADPTATPGIETCSCQEVVIDYTLTTDKNGQPGMQVSAQGGEVIDGHYSPGISVGIQKQMPWAVGASYGLAQSSGDWGIAIQRDFSAIRASLDLFQDNGGIGGRAAVLLRF